MPRLSTLGGGHRTLMRAAVATALALASLALGSTLASAASWSIQTTQNAAGAEDSALYDMACEPSSTSACTAVGRSTTSGVGRPYAQYWNGSAWANQTTATPAGATDAALQADHCLSTTSCVAVGDYRTASGTFSLAEAWNGTSWSIQTTPNPAGVTETHLRGVSCAVISACIAVGWSVSGGVSSAVAERGNSGTWSLQTFPRPAEATATELNGVECMSATSCIAVGRYTVSGGAYWAMAAIWNGTSWSLQTIPRPAEANRSILLDISCADASNCTAVGGFRNATAQLTFVTRWNGTSWSIQTSPNPAGSTNSVMQNVSCPERYSCVAVGDWLNAGRWVPMAHYWNGITWSLDTTPNPSGATFALLGGVACRITCLAVGEYTESGGDQKTLGESRSAPRWTQRTISSPASSNILNGVSCATGPICMAVGVGAGVGQSFLFFEERWSLWGAVAPVGAASSELQDVSCPFGLSCIAAGHYRRSAEGPDLPYAAAWEGFGWTVQTVPLPAEARSGVLSDVSCTSSSACKAVGRFTNLSSVDRTFIVTWNGTTWSVQTSPNEGSGNNMLLGVSCTSSTACTAVGFDGSNALAERWNGTSWAIQRSAPLPPGALGAELISVSCTSSTACTAAGQLWESGAFHPHASQWNGTSWTTQVAPHLSFNRYGYFDDISCTSSTSCVAVGTYEEPSGSSRVLAAGWDGTSWTLHDAPSPGGTGDSILRGVSCLSSSSCQAVGWMSGSRYENLAESYP